jgi:hypothetical protein
METLVRKVADLESQDRSALERVVGHSLKDDQQFIIQIVGLPESLPDSPAVGCDVLPDWCRVYEGLSDEEVDELDQSISRNP